MDDIDNKTPSEILKETKYIIIDDKKISYDYPYNIISLFGHDDEKITDISITQLQTSIFVNYVIENHDDINVFQPSKDELIVPSTQQLYEDLYL